MSLINKMKEASLILIEKEKRKLFKFRIFPDKDIGRSFKGDGYFGDTLFLILSKKFVDKNLSDFLMKIPYDNDWLYKTNIICPKCKSGVIELVKKQKMYKCGLHVGCRCKFRCNNHKCNLQLYYNNQWEGID